MKSRCQANRMLITLALFIACTIPGSSSPVGAAGPWYVAPNGDDANTCAAPGAAEASPVALNLAGFSQTGGAKHVLNTAALTARSGTRP